MKLTSLALALLALAALPAWAGDGDGDGADAPSRFFDTYDANGDGRVTPEEIGVDAEIFRLLDRDGDGAITRTDLGGPADYRPRPGPQGPQDGQRPGPGGPGRGPGAGPGGPPGQGDPGAERHRRLLEMDADGDGNISREEFKGPPELFGRLDANGDGTIDRKECEQAGPRGRQAGRGPDGPGSGQGRGGRMLERLQEFDTDGDGRVSAEEYKGRMPFERLDRNGDGFLDAQDFEGRPGGREGGPGGGPGAGPGQGPGDRPDRDRARMREALKAMDTDGDGKVSAAEYTGPIPFERLDRNGDGFLDAADAPRGPDQGPGRGPGDGEPRRGRSRRGRGLSAEALKRFDQDGDGKVTREEFPGGDERFDLLDANGDGVLTEADQPPPPPPPAEPPAPPAAPAPPPAPGG